MKKVPVFDPYAGERLLSLQEDFAPAVRHYERGRRRYRGSDEDDAAIANLRLRTKAQYSEVFLTQFQTAAAFDEALKSWHDKPSLHSLDREAFIELHDPHRAYTIHSPYGQPKLLERPVFSDPEKIQLSIRQFNEIGNYRMPGYDRNWVFCTTMVATELTDHNLNICLFYTPNNGLPNKADYMADIIAKEVFQKGGVKRPVQTFIYIPAEVNLQNANSLWQVAPDNLKEYPDVIIHNEIPKALDWAYYQCADKINDRQDEKDSRYMAYRGFALRVL